MKNKLNTPEILSKLILGILGLLLLGAIAIFVGRSLTSDRCPGETENIDGECVDLYLKVHHEAIQQGDSAQAIIRSYRFNLIS